MAKKKVSDTDFSKMEKVHNDLNKYVNKDFHFYLSYGARVALILVGVIMIGLLAYYCFRQSFSKGTKEELSYSTSVSLDYKVDLFDNPLVEEASNADVYLSELVDTISNNLTYNFVADENVDVSYSYDVDMTMIIENKNTKEKLRSKEFDDLVEESGSSKNSKATVIAQNIQVDYDYYNEEAKKWEQLADDVSGRLEVKMNIKLKISYDKFAKTVTKEDTIKISIPLLSSQVASRLTSPEGKKDKIVESAKPELVNEPMLYSGVALLILDTIFLLSGFSFMFRSAPKKNKYCRLRDGLLDEYDRIIVNVRKMPNVKGKNIIDCYSFNELVDAQKILDKPIIFYETVKDQKCTFFIIGEDDIYEYTLKECDIEF